MVDPIDRENIERLRMALAVAKSNYAYAEQMRHQVPYFDSDQWRSQRGYWHEESSRFWKEKELASDAFFGEMKRLGIVDYAPREPCDESEPEDE